MVERLLADGKSVAVVDDLSTGSLDNLRAVRAHPRLRVIESQISTCPDLAELVAAAESIYHLAAAVGVELVVRSPIHVIEANLHETEVLLKMAAGQGVPVLLPITEDVGVLDGVTEGVAGMEPVPAHDRSSGKGAVCAYSVRARARQQLRRPAGTRSSIG